MWNTHSMNLMGTRTIVRLIHRIIPLLDIYIQCNKRWIQVASRFTKGFRRLMILGNQKILGKL